MKEQMTQDILKAFDSLQNVSFKINNKKYKFYFRYLTTLEHLRINKMCEKVITTVDDNGNISERKEIQEELYPIYMILEKALDENGNKLFSLTDKKDFDTIKKLPYQLVAKIAAAMTLTLE